MRYVFVDCCARAASGQAVAEPTITLMKSRRRIAFPEAWTTPNRTRLQQGFATDEIGFDGHFARQQSLGPNVRFGSKADIGVECAPDGGQVQAAVLTDCWAWWSSYCTGLM